MTNDAVKQSIDQFMKDHGQYLGYLKDRWTDEKEYEDWSEYVKIMKERFKDYKPTKIFKVGLSYKVGDTTVTIKANKSSFSMKTEAPAKAA